jgi:hypothetical protein
MQLNAAQCLDRLTDIIIFQTKSSPPSFSFSLLLRSEIGDDGLTTKNGFVGWGVISLQDNNLVLTTSNGSDFRLWSELPYIMQPLSKLADETNQLHSSGHSQYGDNYASEVAPKSPLCEIYKTHEEGSFDLVITRRITPQRSIPIFLRTMKKIDGVYIAKVKFTDRDHEFIQRYGNDNLKNTKIESDTKTRTSTLKIAGSEFVNKDDDLFLIVSANNEVEVNQSTLITEQESYYIVGRGTKYKEVVKYITLTFTADIRKPFTFTWQEKKREF